MIGRVIFWMGVIEWQLVTWADDMLGLDFTAAQKAEGFAAAACVMLFGIGLRVGSAQREE